MASAILLFILTGCYYGPPNMASVVKRRGATPRLFSQAEIQIDTASSFHVQGDSPGERVRLKYQSVGESYAGGLVHENVFAVLYFTGQTWFVPNLGLGVIYDRVYAGAFVSSVTRDDEHPLSLQAGCRITDWVTLVVDDYVIVLHDGSNFFGYGGRYEVRRVFRVMPTFTFRDHAFEVAPYAFHSARNNITGFGVTLAATLSGVFD